MSPTILSQALALPLAERIDLVEALWRSIGRDLPDDAEAITEAKRRDAELDGGAVTPRSHAEVLEAARRAIRCP